MDTLDNILMCVKLWWGGDPDKRIPILGMSRRDVYNVQKSWKRINADGTKYGFMIFARLFRDDPKSKSYFFTSDASEKQMFQSVTFQAHLVYVMTWFSAAVNTLDRPEIVVKLTRKLGRLHYRLRIQRNRFREFKYVFLVVLRDEVGCDSEELLAWDNFIDLMYRQMFKWVGE